jgi:sugar (pentulose or hexulose) kinase
MYNDLRATAEAKIIKKVIPENNGGQGASGSLARLLWLLKHEPSSSKSAKGKHAHAVHQADFILGKLSNNFNLSDENNCLKLGYDVLNQCWPKEILAMLGGDSSLLPTVYPAGTAVAQIDPLQAQDLGLPEKLLCVTGTTDSIAAFIATGAEELGSAVTSLGSTLVVKLISDKPIFSSEHGIYSHRLNNQWLVGGASNSGAKVLQHYFSQQQLDVMTENLQVDEPTGLDYYPLLKKGERFPVADAQKQPQLSPRPDSDLMFFQGILEGVAGIERQGYSKLTELGAPPVAAVYTVGGGSRNKAWTQIRKNQLGVNMIKPNHTEAAYGSALLALKGFNQRSNR